MPVTRQMIGTGMTERISTTISFETCGDEEYAELRRWAEATKRNTLENYIASWERFCQSLLAKAQLPPWRKTVHVDAEGNWTEVISEEEIKGLQSGVLSDTCALVESRHGIDSELWFACQILAAIDRVRRASASDDPAKVAWAGVALGDLVRLAVCKFTWDPHIKRSKAHLEGASTGGKARAADKQKEHAEWQAEATKIVTKQPQMPWRRVYEKVAQRFEKSPDTVRKYIRDPRP